MDAIREKIDQLSGLFSVTETVYAWCYDENGMLLCSNCPDEKALDAAFELCVCKARTMEHFAISSMPRVVGLPFGLVWFTAAVENRDSRKMIYALGPVFSSQVGYAQIERGVNHAVAKDNPRKLTVQELTQVVQDLPTLPSNLIQRYVLMLHFLLTGEHLQFSDVSVNNNLDPVHEQKWLKNRDRHKTWMAEQALIQTVREGNLNYKQVFASAQGLSKGVPVSSVNDPLRSGKTSATVFISLCTRAAILGGLCPEEGYSLGDYYIQVVENSNSYSDIMQCNHDMYADFIKRVNQKKKNESLSPQIAACCDYIDFHIEEKLCITDLADRIGYSKYYLSKKFKQETGLTINTYIRDAKIKRAKLMLATTEQDIDTIAEALHFPSRGYFGEVFQQVTGISPAAFRKKNKRV